MNNVKMKDAVPAAPLEIDIESGDKPRQAARRPAPKVPDEPAIAFDPLSVLCATPPPPKEQPVGWGRRIRNLLIGKGLSFFFWHVALPGMLNFGAIYSLIVGAAALLAAWGGYKLHKAPDTEHGRAVARVVGDAPKPSLAARVLDPIKETVAKPTATVKEGAKKAVAKAEDKADELKTEVKEEATEIKGALQGLKAEPPGDQGAFGEAEKPEPQPGLLARGAQKLSDAKDAMVGTVAGAFQGEQPSPEQIKERQKQAEKQRDLIHRKQVQAATRWKKAQNSHALGVMGRQQMAAAAGLAAESAAANQQQMNDAMQWQQNQVDRINRQIRGQR